MKAMNKRLLVLLAAVLLLVSVLGMTALAAEAADEPACYVHGDVNGDGSIDSRDAIRTLFYALWNDSVSVNQNCDFNEDDSVTQKDAIYLLFVSLGMDGYESKGTVHTYLEPIWHWETAGAEPTATVSLKCACGTPHPVTEGITVTAGEKKAPTCVADGFNKYTAKVTYDGADYENTTTIAVPATGDGHSFAAAPTCEAGVKCVNCDFTKPALGHSYALFGEKTDGCKHVKQYQCATCQQVVDGTAESDVYYTHTYTAELTKEATCSAAGEQTLTCACGDVKKEVIPVNETFHVWNEGVKEGNVTTYTCKNNASHTKTAVEMSDTGVSAETLKENEVKLDEAGTSVSLDEDTAKQLDADKAVVIKVDEVNKDNLALDSEKKEQIGDAKVYDFSMLSGNEKVTNFEGKVTVSLPYELQSGEDVNDIDVWFIDDSGNVTSVEGVYNNGFVTFETSHFSYYTVTRMTPAERCARYGHNMVEQNKAATCTEDGYAKKFCLRCGYVEQNDELPMLGHDYKVDAGKSVAATCAAHGTEVSVCANCKAEKTEEVKQLTHDWEKTQSVAATCTTKGYDKYTCKLCKEDKTENEQAATGHSYQVNESGWQWSDDHSKASVTLKCENEGCTAQKALEAVITKKLDGSVCLGGDATYTATVSHNNKTFTDTATGKESGAGQHSPNAKWETTDTQHYQMCAVCGEKVGIADHDWKQTVTQAATCDKSGKATEKCSVCDKERDVILPATGEHSFVNGVCSVCGYTEGDCQHKNMTITEIDLATYGACGGTITVQSCDCGKIRRVVQAEFACDFEDTDDSDEENYIYHYKSVCETCGLIAEQLNYRIIDEATCCAYWMVEWTITKGDTVIVQTKDKESYISYHPMTVEHSPIDLADYGLCAGKLTQTTCPCGLRSTWEMEEGGCQWVFDEATMTVECSVCGATGKASSSTKKEGCTYTEESKTVLYKDGKQVLEVVDRYVEIAHKYKVEDIKKYGQTCDDGVYLVRACVDCGAEHTGYYNWCTLVVEKEKLDTSGIGSCSNSIVLMTCPCGAETSWRYDDFGEEDHEWEYSYDEQTGMDREICAKCGFYTVSEQEQVDPADKDENCRVDYKVSVTYTNGTDSVEFDYNDYRYYHDMQYEFELKGDSCTDGVTITQTCADCALSYVDTTKDHRHFNLKTLDLSAYGYCGETVELYGCACGQEVEMHDYYCEWEQRAGDEGYAEYTCRICGITKSVRWTEIESDQPCVTLQQKSYSYYKDGQLLGTIEFTDRLEYHRYVYTLSLLEGSTTCDEGYEATGTCLECGNVYTTQGGGCSTYPVERKELSGGKMCGVLDQLHVRCACGRYDRIETQWASKETCSFTNGEYSDEYNSWVYTCMVCGCSRYVTNEWTPVEGDPCHEICEIKRYYLDADGAVISVVETQETQEDHDWLYSYTLKGETCADGWSYTITCADCGEQEVYDHVNRQCEPNTVERTLVYDNDAICGPVYLYRKACACGAMESYDVDDSCQGSWDNSWRTCDTCGIKQSNGYSYSHIDGTCRETVEMTYVYVMDGVEVARVEKTYEQADHIYVCTFVMNGTTCEEGYRVYANCVYCDHSEFNGNNSGHSVYRTGYYEYPEGSCGGGKIYVYSCPCGQNKRVEYNEGNCSTSRESWTETDDNGIVHNFQSAECTKCGLTTHREWYYTEGTDACHKVMHQDYTWTLGDWSVNATGTSTVNSHDSEYVSAVLKEGATSCEDGVIVTSRCKTCGYETTSTYDGWHPALVTEKLELAQYGAVCGGTLELHECACGQEKGYHFSEDTLCDLDEKSIDNWVEGSLNTNQFTAEGDWSNTWSDSHTYTCAVTDPACGFMIRMSTYWLAKDCVATEYQTWQLGYDPATGTCKKEVTIATGAVSTYHDYQYESYQPADGVSGSKYTCSACGSYYTELSYYKDGRQAKYVREAVNLLDNGKNQKYTQTWERVYHNDLQYTSLQREEAVHADGSIYWYQYDYTYDFENGCYRTEVYSNSDGETGTSSDVYHRGAWETEWIKNPTCTQFGSYVERLTCEACGKVTEERSYTETPVAHNWSWDADKQTYVCEICGLENVNGATGKIVMEDLTEENGANYVVGYWNSESISFNPYVSLVLYDAAEGEDDELVLDSISVTTLTVDSDGICGLSFSKEATAAAASAALKSAGYTGSYAVRISCVPLGSNNTLDYAITFETLTAE